MPFATSLASSSIRLTTRLTLAITLMSHITPIRATEGVVIVFAREPTLEVIILKQAGLAPEVLMNNLLDGSHPRHCEWLAVTIPDFMHTLISEGGRDNCIPTDWPQMSGIDTHPYLYILVFDVDDGAPFSRLSVGRTSCPSLPVFEGMTHTVRTSSLSSQWGFKGGMTAIVPFLLVKGTMAWKVIVTLVQAAGAAEYLLGSRPFLAGTIDEELGVFLQPSMQLSLLFMNSEPWYKNSLVEGNWCQ
ncbi:hypothetical protein OH76DRAFT_1423999 [Lentinus brumalis]|uniref:Uncharacterized protein n=1 Tax=Lentinus brumalis TaxID=2498619 RepID=A0A371CI45_9APHY|nr:hypothetical protein OH76DRAFT_1423999 [Polyporus brumalis]